MLLHQRRAYDLSLSLPSPTYRLVVIGDIVGRLLLLSYLGSTGLSHLPPSERASWPRLHVNVGDGHTGTTVPVRAVIGCRSLSAWFGLTDFEGETGIFGIFGLQVVEWVHQLSWRLESVSYQSMCGLLD
jgi:hypothetical protein